MESLSSLLQEWEKENPKEDPTASLLEEIKHVDDWHREILHLSADLEDAYHQLLTRMK